MSVLLNVLLGGYSNQTFSARNYQWKREGKPNLVFVIDFIFLIFEKDHCFNSWTYWFIRKHIGEEKVDRVGINLWEQSLLVVQESKKFGGDIFPKL